MISLFITAARAVEIGEKYDSPLKKSADVGKLVSSVLANAHVLAGILMLVLLIFGGFGIMIGAGQDNPERTAQGKKVVTAAVVGFLIIFASYWIIQIIEKAAGISILN